MFYSTYIVYCKNKYDLVKGRQRIEEERQTFFMLKGVTFAALKRSIKG